LFRDKWCLHGGSQHGHAVHDPTEDRVGKLGPPGPNLTLGPFVLLLGFLSYSWDDCLTLGIFVLLLGGFSYSWDDCLTLGTIVLLLGLGSNSVSLASPPSSSCSCCNCLLAQSTSIHQRNHRFRRLVNHFVVMSVRLFRACVRSAFTCFMIHAIWSPSLHLA
jgi:hypothetical protein